MGRPPLFTSTKGIPSSKVASKTLYRKKMAQFRHLTFPMHTDDFKSLEDPAGEGGVVYLFLLGNVFPPSLVFLTCRVSSKGNTRNCLMELQYCKSGKTNASQLMTCGEHYFGQ
jgi:hypothetical protein